MTDTGTMAALLRGRRSVRRFKEDSLSKEVISSIVEAATWAPSAGNRQSWDFIAVTSRPLLQSMAHAVSARWRDLLAGTDSGAADELRDYCRNFDWFATAPVVIAVSTRTPDEFMKQVVGLDAADVAGQKLSAAFAVENLMLAAHGVGVGTCCLTGPLAARTELETMLGLGKRQTLVCLVAMGYPAEVPAPTPRKAVDQIMRFIE